MMWSTKSGTTRPEKAAMATATHRGTVDAREFAALCNLFCATHCDGGIDPAAEQVGDILYHHAYPVVCDHSRLIARAVLAYLGISFGDPAADELVNEVRAAMLNGEGSLDESDPVA
jgi:hypothetical protein